MGRPPLVLETWGKIRRTTVDGRPAAVAHYRDSDGVTRKLQRQGKTPADAERNLVKALRDRLAPSEGITGDTRINTLAALWWEEYEKKDRSDGTRHRYRQVLDANVLPGLGGVLVREATVGRLDRFVKATAEHTGAATARLCAVVLGGMFDMAARHDAVRENPMRSVAPVPKQETEIQIYTVDDVAELRWILRTWDDGLDKRGMKRVGELADVADMFLGTGSRPGELFAFTWPDIVFATTPATAEVNGTVARGADGKLHRQPRPKSRASRRVLQLPPFTTEMLERRRINNVSGNELVFPSSTGTLRAPSNFLLQWHAALKGTRFEGALPKTFRASVATIVKQQAGTDAARDQLGQSSVTVTERHYIKPTHQGPDVTAILESFNVLADKSRVNRESEAESDQQIA